MRRTPLKRKTPIRPVNPERKKARHAKDFGTHADWIRTLPCGLCNKSGPSDPHHVRSRGAGGDRKDLAPLCRGCHTELHAGGVGPAARDQLQEYARRLWSQSPETGA